LRLSEKARQRSTADRPLLSKQVSSRSCGQRNPSCAATSFPLPVGRRRECLRFLRRGCGRAVALKTRRAVALVKTRRAVALVKTWWAVAQVKTFRAVALTCKTWWAVAQVKTFRAVALNTRRAVALVKTWWAVAQVKTRGMTQNPRISYSTKQASLANLQEMLAR
jgi:hypothetical protein